MVNTEYIHMLHRLYTIHTLMLGIGYEQTLLSKEHNSK